MSRALALAGLCLAGCDWLTAANVVPAYCAQLEKEDLKTQVDRLQSCASSSECLCPNSLCLPMVSDAGTTRRCNPPDSTGSCPNVYDSKVVQWATGDECLASCSDQTRQCVGSNGVKPCSQGRCQ